MDTHLHGYDTWKTNMVYDFPRYLAAKKTVDNRALNGHVWQMLRQQMPPQPNILEIGAGIGTMVERLAEQRFISSANYTAIDSQPENITTAQQRLADLPAGIQLTLEAIDLFEFMERERGKRPYNLLIAHAFLDLMDIPAMLPQLFALLEPGGLFYFSINFDGVTTLEPAIDPVLDAQIEQLYHQTMDERSVNGRPSGDSQSGRHLFTHLRQAGHKFWPRAAPIGWFLLVQTVTRPTKNTFCSLLWRRCTGRWQIIRRWTRRSLPRGWPGGRRKSKRGNWCTLPTSSIFSAVGPAIRRRETGQTEK
jgi:predicted O-methyltransferase YrrM